MREGRIRMQIALQQGDHHARSEMQDALETFES